MATNSLLRSKKNHGHHNVSCYQQQSADPQFEPLQNDNHFYFIDNLRVLTMLSVVAVHVILSFTTNNLYQWPIKDIATTSQLFNLLIITLQSFVMPLFFMMAGFVAYKMFNKHGYRQLLQQRFKRIGIPFVIAMCCLTYYHIGEMLLYLTAKCNGLMLNQCLGNINFVNSIALNSSISIWSLLSILNSSGGLWFLYYLMIIYGLLSIYLLFQKLGSFKVQLFLIIGFSLIISLPIRPWYIQTPTSLLPNIFYLLFYFCFFLCGWILYHNQDILNSCRKKYPIYLISACLILGGYDLLQFYFPSKNGINFMSPGLIVSTSYTCASWLILFSLFGLFYQKINHHYKIMSYLANASYWVYLIQLPVIILFQKILSNNILIPVLSVVLIYFLVMITILTSYQLLVRHTFIGRLLNGNKK